MIWSDLAVAYVEASLRTGETRDLQRAYFTVERTLQIDPRRPEALFNRALILEKMGETSEAADAWRRCLDVDRSSPGFAMEAREHLRKIAVHAR